MLVHELLKASLGLQDASKFSPYAQILTFAAFG